MTDEGHPTYRPSLALDSFETLGPYERGAVLRQYVELLCRTNALYAAARGAPFLYKSGVRYIDTHDEWRDIPRVLSVGGGDCKDLVAWRVAELRAQHRTAHPRILMQQTGPGAFLYHVVVQHGDGRYEDPSKLLGM